jgi:hypothetical protein
MVMWKSREENHFKYDPSNERWSRETGSMVCDDDALTDSRLDDSGSTLWGGKKFIAWGIVHKVLREMSVPN